MIEIDQGKLLRGRKISINEIGVLKPITVDEIIEIGEQKYYKYLSNLCFEIDDLLVSKDEKEKLIESDATTFQIISTNCFYNKDYLDSILEALRFFFKENIEFVREFCLFYLGNPIDKRIISNENYEDIKTILKLQNGLMKDDILEENPKDERTKILLEKRRKAREKLAKAKARENNEDTTPLTFADLFSIMCANANGINHENVWNMNIYMFQNQFQRMKLIDDFDISIRSLLAGANPDEIDVKHYMSHI